MYLGKIPYKPLQFGESAEKVASNLLAPDQLSWFADALAIACL